MAKGDMHEKEARVGVPGLDIFRLKGRSISGWLPTFKHVGTTTSHPFATRPEFVLAMYLEYHPWVVSYQRGDVSEDFCRLHDYAAPLGMPYAIGYEYDGAGHHYLPDYVGTLVDGGLFIAEAGLEDQKAEDQPLAKAEAARRWVAMNNGVYWLGLIERMSRQQHENWVYLHARRAPFPEYEAIKPAIIEMLPPGARFSVREIVAALGRRWPEKEVVGAAWKVAGDAAAAGRLLVDLTEIVLDHDTPLALAPPDATPILPEPLPSALPPDPGIPPLPDGSAVGHPGPTVDHTAIVADAKRERFLRNLHAVEAVCAGGGVSAVAREYGMAKSTLSRLVNRAKTRLGQAACVPYATYERDSTLHPDLRARIRELHKDPRRPTIAEITESAELKEALDALNERRAEEEVRKPEASRAKPLPEPTYRQVYHFIRTIEDDQDVADARSGLKHPPPLPSSTKSFVLSIQTPGMIVQVDEHDIDVNIVALDGTVIARKIHGAALICVKTGVPLAALVRLTRFTEDDYMCLVKMAIESKDNLVQRYGCKHPWRAHGKVAIIFSDNGSIFTSHRAKQVIVDRLRITEQIAPLNAPSAKGTVEAWFAIMERMLIQRLPNTTKSDPEARGAHDPVKAALKSGITLDIFEGYFYRAITDDYLRRWDDLRGGPRWQLWDEGVERFGVVEYLGLPSDLLLLLMKRVNRRNANGRYPVRDGKLSFLNRTYVNPAVLNQLRGREFDIYYDRRDITVLYLFLDGKHVGEAYCRELNGRRVSEAESKAIRAAQDEPKKAANREALENRREILSDSRQNRQTQQQKALEEEKRRQLDRQRDTMHPPAVHAVLNALAAQHEETASTDGAAPPPEPPTNVVPLPVPVADARRGNKIVIRLRG